MNTNLMQASRQWATRPNDERFLSLEDLKVKVAHMKPTNIASGRMGARSGSCTIAITKWLEELACLFIPASPDSST
jgi:hypothetical protein